MRFGFMRVVPGAGKNYAPGLAFITISALTLVKEKFKIFIFAERPLVGNQQCFRRIDIQLTFNSNRKIIGREIVGGEFISVEEFDAS